MEILFLTMLLTLSVAIAQEGPGIVIVHPAGQDVELPCSVAIPGADQIGVTWIINFNQYGVSSLANGILDGYSADINSSNLIVKNMVMNDIRDNTEYRCVIIMSDRIVNDSDPIFLYVAGVPNIVPNVTVRVSGSTNGNNVTITLSWGEPFNNLDPIVNYFVSCSGDVKCPPNFTTTDSITRSYTITNLTPMTSYTFSVVATNSIGSGEASVVMITTPGTNVVATTSSPSIMTIGTMIKPATTPIDTTTTSKAVVGIATTISSSGIVLILTTSTKTSSYSIRTTSTTVDANNAVTTTSSPSVMTSGTIIKTTTISIETTNTSKSVVDTSTGYSIRTTNSTVDANNADTNDSNNSATLIGAVVGVICVVILIIVISNIMIWIYCFRKRHHTGPQHISPTDEEAINPTYNTISDNQFKQPVNEPVGYYAEVIIPTAEVKMTANPAYAML